MIELLWIRDVDQRPVKRPVAILSAAPPKIVADWRKRNAWADNVPLTLFGSDDELGTEGDSFNDDPRNNVPNCAANAPPDAVDAFARVRGLWIDVDARERAWLAYEAAIRYVAREIPAGPAWVIGADADEGMLAVVASHERIGMVAAVAGGSIGGIGASLAAKLGVNVGVVQHDNRIVL